MYHNKPLLKLSFYFLFIPFGCTSFIPFWLLAKATKNTYYWILGSIYLFSASSTVLVSMILPGNSGITIIVFCLNLIIWLESIYTGLKIRKDILNLKTSYIHHNESLDSNKEKNDYVMELIHSVKGQIHSLYSDSKDIPHQLQPVIFSILLNCEEIVNLVEATPQDYMHVRSFFTGYFSSFRSIVYGLKNCQINDEQILKHENQLQKINLNFNELVRNLSQLKEERLHAEINLLNDIMKQDNK